jgi:hypothetical protein
MVTLHEVTAGGREHAALGVDLFREVLGLDERVVTTEAGDLTGEVLTIRGDFGGDLSSIDEEKTLEAILRLEEAGEAHLTSEEGLRGPGGTPEDGSSVGAGGHGCEVAVPFGGEDGLGFVAVEKEVGGGAYDAGGGTAGEEGDAGGVEVVDMSSVGDPAAAGEGVGIQNALKTKHGDFDLGKPGGGDFNDIRLGEAVSGEQVGFELSLELVLTGLAGEDDDEGEASVGLDAVEDGVGNETLVGTQGETGAILAEGVNIAEEVRGDIVDERHRGL